MPTIDENEKFWGGEYSWVRHGAEWSADWGSVSMQWYGTILPRIQQFVPTDNILEIGCGYGRWTDFLKDKCQHLIAIDLSEECIEACKQRFHEVTHIACHANDGKSLQMVADNSIDFVFSFDSLVLVDELVMERYISQLPKILKDEGVAFLHHSNLGEYYSTYAKIRTIPKLEELLTRLGILEKDLYWRDFSVSAKLVDQLTTKYGLQCISQELIRWGTKRLFIDGFSTIVKESSSRTRDNRLIRNANFMQEANNLYRLAQLYAESDD